MPGIVEEIYIATKGSEPTTRVEEVEAVAGGGLRGDRYMERTGYWTGIDECQVTLIEGEAIDLISVQTEIKVTKGEHRRNIITRGIELDCLHGKQFTIGEAQFEYDRPRPPCGYIQSITQTGMTRALSGGRGGICVRVVKSGVFRPGDSIEVESS